MTEALRRRLAAVGLLVLRLGAGGLLFGGHGLSKWMHFSERSATFPDPLHVGSTTSLALAVFAEGFCSLLVIAGAGTRLATIPILVTMSVAALIVHAGAPFTRKELALIYALPFLTLLLTGPGPFSVDGWIAARRRS